MKTLNNYAAEHGLTVRVIRYRHQFGYCKRKGYDLVNKAGHILISLEPCDYSNGDKWHIRNSHKGYNGPSYIKRISRAFLSCVDPLASSFIRTTI